MKYVAGAAAGVVGTTLFPEKKAVADEAKTDWPWPYEKIDPEHARLVAHDCFHEYGCCYAGFAGVLKPLQDKVGEPFTTIPLEMMSYGYGGVKGWGTLCGTLNGVSAAISLVRDSKNSAPLIQELMNWYSQERLPTDVSNRYAEEHRYKAGKVSKLLPQSVSGSPLCHISVTTWSGVSGHRVDEPERLERCARLSGDVVAQTVQWLNEQAEGGFLSGRSLSASTEDCLSCHGPRKPEGNVFAKMGCVQCHGDPHE
jgi:hypothetical protein